MFLITGGAGFIGSNVVAALEERRAAPPIVCDRLRVGNKWRNIAKRELHDLINPETLFDFLEAKGGEIEGVIHMGAVSSTTETDADLILDTNFQLSIRLWAWCAEHGVRFIYASSAATYGHGDRGFDDDASLEALAELRPLNVYGWSKHLFDRWVIRRMSEGGSCPPQWAGLKFFNVYGPNEYHKGPQASVVSHVYPTAKAGRTARLFKSHNPDYLDGGQLRDFIWVGDCIDVMMWLVDNEGVSGLFNCGTGNARSFADLAGAVYRALGKEPAIEYVPTPEAIREKYQYFTEARLDRLRAAGYRRPFTSLEDGITAYVQGYLDRPDPYS